jgi:GWxTD domain-containing protein
VKKLLFIIAVVTAMLAGCFSGGKLTYINFASLYDDTENFTHAPAMVFHAGDSVSTVFVKVRLKDLLYAKQEKDPMLKARFMTSYEVYPSFESKLIVDSGSAVFCDSLNFGTEMEMIVNFNVKVKFPGTYLLYLNFTDLNRERTVGSFYTIGKESVLSRQNFMAKAADDLPLFDPWINADSRLKILYNRPVTGALFVRYYHRTFPLALPPFVPEKERIFRFGADSVFLLPLVNGESALFSLEKEGIYHFQVDSSSREGLTLFRFHEGFPEVETPREAIRPLRYLTTDKEYERLLNGTDQKQAVDSFWIERAGNPERAVTMIRKYYTRVSEANRWFSSYHEGWKTDRGIIYIVYGKPTYVYRTSDAEEWIYGEQGNPLSIKFIFRRVNNPFSDNDFGITKSVAYKQSWYLAIESWRR